MALNTSLVDRLPSYLPESAIRTTESIEIEQTNGSVPKTVYSLEKAPYDRLVDVSAVVDGSRQSLEVDEDVEARSTRDDERPNKVAFVSDPLPDADTTARVTYDAQPVVSRYLGAFDDDMDTVGEQLDESVLSKYVGTAEGRDLDRIGAQFGELGRRGRRSDAEYRQYLRSIVRAFNATGTKSGIQFVTGAVLEIDPDLVEVIEDFDTQSFTVRVEHPESQVQTTSLNSLIDLASPSGVDASKPPTLYLERRIGIRAKKPLLEKSSPQLSLVSTITDVVQKTQLGFDTDGFEAVNIVGGLGSSTINSDRTLGSLLETRRTRSEIGMSSAGSQITDRSDGLSSSELDSGDTYN